jgi:hypothetical protein
MNGNVVMKAKDTVFAALAECFITMKDLLCGVHRSLHKGAFHISDKYIRRNKWLAKIFLIN